MFGERLKGLRARHGLTQEQLASIIGVERSSIGKYEGKKGIIPSVDVLNTIADYFDVSIDYLLGRSDKHASPDSPDFPQPKTIAAHITGEDDPVIDATLEKRIQEIVKEAFEKYGNQGK